MVNTLRNPVAVLPRGGTAWTAAQALDEMEDFKFCGFWFRHLKNYVLNFPEPVKTNPALRAVAPAPPAFVPPTP